LKLILPFHSYHQRSKQVASRRLVNCYPEQVPLPGKAPIALFRDPGIRDDVTLPTMPVRGTLMHAGLLYAVGGSRLYSVTEGGVIADLGAILGSDRVKMATNGTELVIVSRPHGYIYTVESGLTQIVDPDFTVRGASDVACIDSFMVFIEPDSQNVFSSEFDDAGNFGPLATGPAFGSPDKLVAILVDHRQIFLFGVTSIELWYNAGASPFPFLREQNGFIEVGCAARDSPVKADNTVMWLDDKRIFRKLVDMTPQRASTHAIEERWETYARVDDAYSVTYIHKGHTFVAITFPSAGETWVLDLATNEWHERSSRTATGAEGYWRVTTNTFAYGSNIVGDSRSGKLGIMDAETKTEWGNIQRMEWTYPHVYAEGRRAFHKRLEIVFESGTGLNTGQGSDPKAMLYVSDNGGVSFDPVQTRSIGRIGEYRHRAVWNRLGSAEHRVYKVAVSDPVEVVVIDTQLEVEGGRL